MLLQAVFTLGVDLLLVVKGGGAAIPNPTSLGFGDDFAKVAHPIMSP